MNVIIVEDELAASDNLSFLLKKLDPQIEVIKVIDSVNEAVTYFSDNKAEFSLIFMDIHLADGLSFEIFDRVQITTPIIFTTAYDQYSIQAFKLNSVDYLLKPINSEELDQALTKFKNTSQPESGLNNQLEGLLQQLQGSNKKYKSTYLVQKRDELIPIKVTNIAYFYIETGIVKGQTFDHQTFIVDKKLEDIEMELDPSVFNRVNRQFIINKNAISNIKFYFNGKLVVNTDPKYNERIFVSKAKAKEFKRWMDN